MRYEPKIMKWLSGSDKESGVMVGISEMFQRSTVFAYQQIPIGQGLPDPHRFSLKTAKGLTADDTEILADKDSWVLLSAMDGAGLLVGLEEYTTPFLFFTIFLLVGCILIAILVGVLVSRPVVSLAGAAKRIQDGNLSARAEINSRDEMGQFGRLFNNMAADLEKLINRIKASETRYRQLFENSRDCFFAADTSGRITDMNRACAQMLGVSLENNNPSNFYIPWYNEDSKDPQALHETLYGTGYVKDYEVHLKRSDDSHLVCFMTAHVRSKEDGTIQGCEGGLRDITERRRRIMARRDFRRRLQEEIAIAEERERRSMGEVLHEELAQNLALVQMKVQETEALLTEPTSDVKNTLKESQILLGQMIRQIRTMIFDLYPAILDEQGLVPAMQWYAQSFSERTGIVATVYELSATTSLTRPQEVYLFRTFKELLNNVWKHAEANEVVATVAGKDGRLRLVVDDDGKGFDTRAAFEFSPQLKGIGLFSIREWITNMDGHFTVESNQGKGTRILIEIPLSHNAGEKN